MSFEVNGGSNLDRRWIGLEFDLTEQDLQNLACCECLLQQRKIKESVAAFRASFEDQIQICCEKPFINMPHYSIFTSNNLKYVEKVRHILKSFAAYHMQHMF